MERVLSTIKTDEPEIPDRVLGNYWSQVFADMMNEWYGVHKFDKAPSPVVMLPNKTKVVLADVLLLERMGENYYCEVKHKAPNRHDSFGLEKYRFDSLQRLQEYVKAVVLYVIHDHSLNGGKHNCYNDMAHWKAADAPLLARSQYKTYPGNSLVNSVVQKVLIHYWQASLWVPLQEYFPRIPAAGVDLLTPAASESEVRL